MPTESMIERRLWLAAESRASLNGFELAPDCADLLRRFVHGGAEKLVSEGYSNDYEKIHLAEANIVAFVAEMINTAFKQNLERLPESMFLTACSTLCPIWPFC
jgi:hypothetical protein